MNNNKEKRFFRSQIQARALEQEKVDGQRIIEGYFALYNSESDLITEYINGKKQSFYEVIEPDAFRNAKFEDTIFTVEHSFSRPIARLGVNLELSVDEKGLFGRATIPARGAATTEQEDLLSLINQGIIAGNSFWFTVKNDSWERSDDKLIHKIHEIGEVFDITATISPAYSETEIYQRSITDEIFNRVIENKTETEIIGEVDSNTIDLEFELERKKNRRF